MIFLQINKWLVLMSNWCWKRVQNPEARQEKQESRKERNIDLSSNEKSRRDYINA
jgi:hypothetical protein